MYSSTIICLPPWHVHVQRVERSFCVQFTAGEPSPQTTPPRLTSPLTPPRTPDADSVDTNIKHNYVTSQILSLEGSTDDCKPRTVFEKSPSPLKQSCSVSSCQSHNGHHNGHQHETHELHGSVSDGNHRNNKHRASTNHSEALVNGSVNTDSVLANGHIEGHEFTRSNGHHDLDLDTVDSHNFTPSKPRTSCLHINQDVRHNGASTVKKDGAYFLQIVDDHDRRLKVLMCKAEGYLQSGADIPEDVSGFMRTAVGKTNLLITNKFPHFRGFCNKNLKPSPDERETTGTDLEGLWAIVSMQIDDIIEMHVSIENMKKRGWTLPKEEVETNTPPASKPKLNKTSHVKTTHGKTPHGKKARSTTKDHTDGSATRSRDEARTKAREEARKRLLAAKKAGRQRKASQSDEVEIYVPT